MRWGRRTCTSLLRRPSPSSSALSSMYSSSPFLHRYHLWFRYSYCNTRLLLVVSFLIPIYFSYRTQDTVYRLRFDYSGLLRILVMRVTPVHHILFYLRKKECQLFSHWLAIYQLLSHWSAFCQLLSHWSAFAGPVREDQWGGAAVFFSFHLLFLTGVWYINQMW